MNPKEHINIVGPVTSATIDGSQRERDTNKLIPFSATELFLAACELSRLRGGDPVSYFPLALGGLEQAAAFLEQQERHYRKVLLQRHAHVPTSLQRYSVTALKKLGVEDVSFDWVLTPIERPTGDLKHKKGIMRLGSIAAEESLCKTIRKALPVVAERIIKARKLTLPQLKALEAYVQRKLTSRNRTIAGRRQ